MRENENGEKILYETYEIPSVIDQEILSLVIIDTNRKHVTFRTETKSPRPPEYMGCATGKLISSPSDRLHICENFIKVPSHGVIVYITQITSGDPLGAHEIKTYIDDLFIEKFNFILR